MKAKLIFSLLILASFSIKAQDMFYYYKGNKIDLKVDKNYLNIIAKEELQNFSDSISNYFSIVQDENDQSRKITKLKFKSTPNELEYTEVLKTLKRAGYVKYAFPYFERSSETPSIGTSDIFYLKLKEKKDTTILKQIVKERNVHMIEQIAYMPYWYILSVQNSVFSNAIEASNFFYETGYFADIDPAFMFDFKPQCTNDPMFNQLWGLSNSSDPNIDINACDAWTITRGAGIHVAVVDQGIHMTHNDLSANISPVSFDAQSGTSPSVFVPGEAHGTHVTGTVAAVRNNNLQVVGVAPESTIIGVSHDLYISSTISAELADGISWAWQNNADIITNSWGDQGGLYYNELYSAVLEDAIINAMTQGRNGKGCIVTFAAGNWGVMDYPAYFDDRIITVGAIEANGSRASFSAYGNELDIVAPGVDIVSTIPNNGTASYSGTSMATPHVAGVAALILSINPNLTRTQVTAIIESTAQKVGGYNYQITSGRPNGIWNQEMGYGLVDAYAAVQAADCPTTIVSGTISSDITYSDCIIEVVNATIQNNADVVFDAEEYTLINGTFEVQAGSTLEVK
ncbi:MAG TPA: peptidase S8 [Ignavibacteria bacterium]|nr:peptidase S8 [Ignavibacteria bacterium]